MVLPSHLIRHYLPSDEDYKTLPFVIAPQRWVKDLEYASLTLLFSSDEEAIEVSHVNLGVMKGPRTEISADKGGDIRQQGRRYLPVRTEISASKDGDICQQGRAIDRQDKV